MRRAYANMLRETQQKDKNNANDEVHEKSNTSRARKRGKLDAVRICKSWLEHASGLENHFFPLILYIVSPFYLYEERREIKPR